jgi:hypothetical protein
MVRNRAPENLEIPVRLSEAPRNGDLLHGELAARNQPFVQTNVLGLLRIDNAYYLTKVR